MADPVVNFQEYLNEEVNKVKGVYYTVRASFLKRKFCKKASCRALHPNPEDEFCFPDIGPNYGIIKKYQQQYRQGVQFKTGFEENGILEPLMVQKTRPDGYMILNGHHRWAAAIRSGVGKVKIKIVNLTQVSDIRKMIENSQSDRRVTLDLDEVVFCGKDDPYVEKPLPFPMNRFFKERIRKGIWRGRNLFFRKMRRSFRLITTLFYYSTRIRKAQKKRTCSIWNKQMRSMLMSLSVSVMKKEKPIWREPG